MRVFHSLRRQLMNSWGGDCGLWNPSSSSSMGREGEEGEEGEGSCDNHLIIIIIMSEDVLIEILLCLPVISLLRFKSVCKSWRSIIESPFFINLHAATTNTATNNSSFVFFRYEDHCEEEEERKRNVFTQSGDKFEVFEDLGRPSVEFEEIEYWGGRKSFYNGILMVGCCNGIICLHDSFSRSVALWNPAIKQSIILPKPSNLLGNHFNLEYSVFDFVGFGFGFGFDHVVKTTQLEDYKVLLITSKTPKEIYHEDNRIPRNVGDDKTKFPYARSVQVYSLSSHSWKCIDDANLSAAHPDLDLNTSYRGLHLNARYFFMGKYYINKVEEEEEEDMTYDPGLQPMPLIMSFDFTQEIFTTIELPYNRRNKFDPYSYAGLLLFGEKIALIDFTRPYDESDIWVLNEQQGVVMMEESWTKFYTIGPYRSAYSPLCIVDNGEFAIMYGYDQKGPCQDDLKLQLFNLSTGETNDLQCDCRGLRIVDVYKPSLVPIGGNSATNDKPICGL